MGHLHGRGRGWERGGEERGGGAGKGGKIALGVEGDLLWCVREAVEGGGPLQGGVGLLL